MGTPRQTPDTDAQQGRGRDLVRARVGRARLPVGLLVPPDLLVGTGDAGPHVGGLGVSRSFHKTFIRGGGWRARAGGVTGTGGEGASDALGLR